MYTLATNHHFATIYNFPSQATHGLAEEGTKRQEKIRDKARA